MPTSAGAQHTITWCADYENTLAKEINSLLPTMGQKSVLFAIL